MGIFSRHRHNKNVYDFSIYEENHQDMLLALMFFLFWSGFFFKDANVKFANGGVRKKSGDIFLVYIKRDVRN